MDARGGAIPADGIRGEVRAAGDAPAARTASSAASAASAAWTPASDRELLELSRRGDRAAFGRLVDRHHRALAAILRQRAGAAAPVEDLVQEVFARALAHIDGFRRDAAFLTWATSIGLHLATDWHRKDARRRRLAPASDIQGDAVPCERRLDGARLAEERDEVRRARRALDALPADVRAAVTLRIVEDRSYDEIAASLGVPVTRVRQWVSRGLRKLRSVLEVDDDAS